MICNITAQLDHKPAVECIKWLSVQNLAASTLSAYIQRPFTSYPHLGQKTSTFFFLFPISSPYNIRLSKNVNQHFVAPTRMPSREPWRYSVTTSLNWLWRTLSHVGISTLVISTLNSLPSGSSCHFGTIYMINISRNSPYSIRFKFYAPNDFCYV